MSGNKPFGRIVAALLAGACLAALWAVPGRRPDPRRLVLGTPDLAYSGLVVIAREKGYLAGQGIDLTIRQFPTGLAATEAMARGEIDLACVAEIAFALPAMRDPSLRIVASIASADTHAVVVRTDRGIGAPRDLRGRRIGQTPGTTGEYYLSWFLVMNGIAERDVELVDLKPDGLVEALAAGEVDAVSTWDLVTLSIRQRLGEAVREWPSQEGQDFFWTVAARQDFIERSPEAIEGVLRALIQAETFVRGSGEEAKAMVSGYWGYGPEFTDEIWPRFRQSVTLNQALVISMEAAARWQIRKGRAEAGTVPDVVGFISFAGLERAAPNRVTVFR